VTGASPAPPVAITPSPVNSFWPKDFSCLRPEVRGAAAVALGLAVIVTLDQSHYWATREDFSFGFLVPLFVAYVLNDRWPQLRAIWLGTDAPAGRPERTLTAIVTAVALLTVAGSLLLCLYGGFLRAVTGPDDDSALFLAVGLGGFVLGMGFLVSRFDAAGRPVALARRGRVVALLVFPALVWLVSAPILLIFETRIKGILLTYVVGIVSGLLDFLGFTVYQQGNLLILPKGTVGVEDACSGIRSLTACLFSGSFLAAVFLDKFWKKFLLLAMSAMLAFVMNVGRSLFLTSWAYANGADALNADFWGHRELVQNAAGQYVTNPAFRFITVHDFAGYSVLGFTLVGLLLLIPLLNYRFEFHDPRAGKANRPAQQARVKK
jgi:exosortase/archaeosortase family protein